jgi:drug/metabolite transporter (DMT)-like permease
LRLHLDPQSSILNPFTLLPNHPHPLRGALLIMGAVLVFSFMDTIAKYLGRFYPVTGLLFARYLAHLLVMIVWLAPRMKSGVLRPHYPVLQIIRGVLLVCSTFCFFHALRFLPLAEASAIGFLHPLLLVALSGPMLKEKVRPARWVAVIAGFSGVLIIVRPGGGLLTPAALLPMAMALFFSLYQIITRMLSGKENSYTTLFYTAFIGSVVSVLGIVVPGGWITPSAPHALLILCMGVLGASGHFMMIKAFDSAPASSLAPFAFSQIIWVTLLGYFFYNDFPSGGSLLGMAIIAASGLYVALSERRRAT